MCEKHQTVHLHKGPHFLSLLLISVGQEYILFIPLAISIAPKSTKEDQ